MLRFLSVQNLAVIERIKRSVLDICRRLPVYESAYEKS